MTWRGGLTLLLLAAALLSGWSAWHKRVMPAPPAAAANRSDYVLTDFELVALDKQGVEAFILRAPRLARDPADRTISLQTPLFLLPDKDGKRWTVVSKTGWVSADNSEVRLRGDVVATSPEGAVRSSTLRTQSLDIFPDTRKARSAEKVVVASGGSTMQGVGMQADLAGNRIQLLSEVTSRYAPLHR